MTQKILPLTSVRFLAALLVVLYHAGPSVPWLSGSNVVARCIRFGYVSVSFFFVLSAFVLALAYLQSGRPLVARKFLIARFARIYPALAVCLLLDLPHFLYGQLHVLHQSFSRTAVAVAIGFFALEAWFPRIAGLDFPSWSIAVEVFST